MCSLAPLSHDPRTEWNHSINGLSSAMLAKTIMGPNLSLRVKKKSVPKTSLRGQVYFFVILLLFSSRSLHTHTHSHAQRSEVGVAHHWLTSCPAQQPSRSSVTTCLPRKRPSSLSLNNSLPAPRPTPISCFHRQIH